MPKGQYTRNIPIRPIFIPIGPSIAYVPLTRGVFALIDSEDAALVGQYNWHGIWSTTVKQYYVYRLVSRKPRRYTSLHRYLSGVDGLLVDHKNGVTLDNRRINLRPATHSQNRRNSKRRSDRKHNHPRGVYLNPSGTYSAQIGRNEKLFHLGTRNSAEEAHQLYVSAVNSCAGEFARYD